MYAAVQTGNLDLSSGENTLNTIATAIADAADGAIVTATRVAAAASTVVARLTLAAGRIAKNGQGNKFTIWGTNDADAGAKTVVLNFGWQAMTFTVTGANANYLIKAVILRSGVDTQVGIGELLLTATKSLVLLAGTQDDGAAIAVNVTATNAAGASTVKGVIFEQVR